jgi:hypothetical protein
METRIVEVTNGPQNWGKFMVARFTREEWAHRSVVADVAVVEYCGWSPRHLWVLDLQTGEGACFAPWGVAGADLNGKHKVWVCPLFEPFLNWLYARTQAGLPFETLPAHVDIPDAPFNMSGYRREGRDLDARG